MNGNSSISPETRLNETASRFISYGLVVLMLTCAILTFSSLVKYIFMDWPVGVSVAVALFIVAERLYTYQSFSKMTIFSREWFSAFGVQFIASAVFIRVAIGSSHGIITFMSDLRSSLNNPIGYLFIPEFGIFLVLSLILWFLAGNFAELLDEMGLDQAFIARELHSAVKRDGPSSRERLQGLVFSLGIVLVVFTALTRVNLRTIIERSNDPLLLSLGAFESGGASTLLYFVFGLALLGQSQFINLFTRWSLEGISISPSMPQKWVKYSLFFLVILAGVTAFFPTNYSLGFLGILGSGFGYVIRGVVLIGQFLLSLLIFLLGLPFLLFGRHSPVENFTPVATETPQALPPVLPEVPVELSIWSTLYLILSWGVLLVILGYVYRQFLRQHESLFISMRKLPGGKWLAIFWGWLLGLFRNAQKGMVEVFEAGRERLRLLRRMSKRPSTGWMSIRALDSRQRILFFYLALIRRGSERGLPRESSQTPYEYAVTLEQTLPDSNADINSLTDEFIKARYSRQSIPEEEAAFVRRLWGRISKAFRTIVRGSDDLQ